MMLVPLVVLLVVAAAFAVVRFTLHNHDDGGHTDERRDRVLGASVGGLVAWVAAGVIGLGVLAAATMLLGIGARETAGSDPEADEEVVKPPTAAPRPAGIAADVEIEAADDLSLTPPAVADDVADGETLIVRAHGFAPDVTGEIAMCVEGACRGRFPVRFDEEGVALVQYAVDVPDGACRVTGACALLVRSDDATGSATLLTGTRAPASPTVRIVSDEPARVGGRLAVEVAGTARAVDVLLCPTDPRSRADCPTRVTGTRDHTTGVTTAEFAAVPRGAASVVAVDRVTSAALTIPAPFRVAARPGPRYVPARVAIGVVAAFAFLVLALVLARRTDWREPAGAATPALEAISL